MMDNPLANALCGSMQHRVFIDHTVVSKPSLFSSELLWQPAWQKAEVREGPSAGLALLYSREASVRAVHDSQP